MCGQPKIFASQADYFNRPQGKVMFQEASVILSTGGGVCLPTRGVCLPTRGVYLLGGGLPHGEPTPVVTSTGMHYCSI